MYVLVGGLASTAIFFLIGFWAGLVFSTFFTAGSFFLVAAFADLRSSSD